MAVMDKVERLLQLTKTPPDRLEAARSNYQRLIETHGESALDARIAEFEGIEVRLSEWKAERDTDRPKITLASVGPDFLVQEKLVARSLEELLERVGRLIRHQHVTRSTIQGLLVDALTERAELSAFSDVLRDSVLMDVLLQVREHGIPSLSIMRRLRRAFRQKATYIKPSRVDTEQTITGLSDIALYVRELDPDVIITVNPGGELIGDFLKTHLQLTTAFIALFGRHDKLAPRVEKTHCRANRPLVVDSTARSGATVKGAMQWVQDKFPGTPPNATTLAASAKAISALGSEVLFTPNPTFAPIDQLPYDTQAGFEVMYEGTTYVFGATAEQRNQLVVPAAIISKIMMERAGETD